MLGSARSVFNRRVSGTALPSAMALYSFSEGTGTTAADSSGNSRTLTLNSATWTASGHTGNAITNTGTNLGASANGFVSPTNTVSIMAWVKPLDLTAGTTHFAFGFIDNAGSTNVAFFTQRADFSTSNVLQANIRIVGTGLVPLNGSALTVGTWAHLALTYDGSTVIMYKDGVSVASTSVSGAIQPGDGFFVAGKNTNGLTGTDVVVDDVRVYNPALTQAQVVLAMNTPVT